MRKHIKIIIFISSILGIMFFSAVLGIIWLIHLSFNSNISLQRKLVYSTNSKDLYEACMYVDSHAGDFHTNPIWENGTNTQHDSPNPKDPLMPKIIKDLSPRAIGIASGEYVKLEFGGGDYHYGIMAFMNGTKEFGTKMLGPHLWYYSEDGKIPLP